MTKKTACICILIACSAAAPAHPQTNQVEAENYTDFHDMAYEVIRGIPDPDCSGGYILIGLDFPDEWTSYDSCIDSAGVYSTTLLCRGDLGIPYRLRLIIEEPGAEPQEVEFDFTGAGYG